MSNIIRFGIHLANNSFAVCGIDEHGRIVFKKTLTRARQLKSLGHDARIIDPRLVAPYRQ